MTPLFRSARQFLAVFTLCLAAHSHCAPQLDSTFGIAGTVRIGVPGVFDRIDRMVIDPVGRILLVGFSDGSGVYDYLLSRLKSDGTLDTSYGSGGRLSPQQNPHYGLAHAALQPDGGLVVVSGDLAESPPPVPPVLTVTAFRARAEGDVDSAFKPVLEPAGPAATVGLAVRPNGRVIYGTHVGETAFLQQLLPDGTPDRDFGVLGKVGFTTGFLTNRSDLVLLGDGSVVFAVVSYSRLAVYKVDAQGALVPGFGNGGIVTHPVLDGVSPASAKLFALTDGTFAAIYGAGTGLGQFPSGAFTVLRLSSVGQVLDARTLLADGAYASYSFAALPDSSIIIGRSFSPFGPSPQAPSLYRLLPGGDFDAAFGPNSAFEINGMTQLSALAVDAEGRLLISGQDAQSAVVARFRLDGPATGVAVLEYYNVGLGHYFITASVAETANIDAGGAGPGWQRTGYGFVAFVPEVGVPIGALPVCRFYGTRGIGPNSHFYTADPDECALVRKDPGWTYEGIAFYAFLPVGGQCAVGGNPVNRAYNNRFAQNDSNHRYTTDPAIYQAMLGQGWVGEGVRFCTATAASHSVITAALEFRNMDFVAGVPGKD